MSKPVVSVTSYRSSPQSLRQAIGEADGLERLKPTDRVLIKPNLVGWDPDYPIAPYGVYTTSRIVEDLIAILKEFGVGHIRIGEGSVRRSGEKKPDQARGARLIFQALGYGYLEKRYGVELVDFFEEPFQKADFGDFSLNISQAALESDFVVNMPVLKTHNQTRMSLGFKNLKGCIDLESRRLCHNVDVSLNVFCSFFVEAIRPGLTVLDGIYCLEKGPYYLGTAHRSNVLVVSRDPLAVDAVGARIAGYEPQDIGHLRLYAERNGRSLDADAFILKGEPWEGFRKPLPCDFSWRQDDTGPKAWDKLGIRGLAVRKYDQTICTGCSSMFNPLLMLLTSAWYAGQTFDEIEVLSGKRMSPSPGFNRTILLGNCMIKKNRKNPSIKEAILMKGCPVTIREIRKKLEEAGIAADIEFFAKFREKLAHRYDANPDFAPEHYFMPGALGRVPEM